MVHWHSTVLQSSWFLNTFSHDQIFIWYRWIHAASLSAVWSESVLLQFATSNFIRDRSDCWSNWWRDCPDHNSELQLQRWIRSRPSVCHCTG
jgi:hypothetical protein